jgi:hypothetical protein
VIKVTGEMQLAFIEAKQASKWGPDTAYVDGLAAVLAVVERDQPLAKAAPGEDACGKAHPDRPYTCQRRARHDVCVSWQGGSGATAWAIDYDDLVAQIEALRELLAKLVDEDPCQFDHHGYCQAHGLDAPPCPHQVAKVLLGGRS